MIALKEKPKKLVLSKTTKGWLKWFAWYPVRVEDKLVWLKNVELRTNFRFSLSGYYSAVVEKRLIK